MKIVAVRTDEKLIHGKIINDWCQSTRPTHLFIVDDDLVKDTFMSNVFISLAPSILETIVCSTDDLKGKLEEIKDTDGRVFILCKTPISVYEIYKKGINFDSITIADKKYLSKRMEINQECIDALKNLIDCGIRVYAQNYPYDECITIEQL